MTTQPLNWTHGLACWLGLCVIALPALHAQQSRGGGGGFGGFGGNRGSGQAASGNTAAQTYNANGAVGNATISYDPDTHNITVIGDEATTRSIAAVITNLDRPQPQVLIKVVFLQVTHSDALDLGVEGGWMNGLGNGVKGVLGNVFGLSGLASGTGSNAPVVNALGQPLTSLQAISPYTAGAGAGMYQVLGNDFQATLRAIAQAGKADVLSRPSILARNNQPASVVVGQYVPLITSVSYNTVSGAPINSVTYKDVGIILTVTPYITQDGLIEMIVAPQSSALNQTTTVTLSQGVSAPVIDVISADTVAITPSGQTVVIGGLMQSTKASTEQKIPLLGDIPWLGNLFKRTVTSNSREELMIFLTPYVIRAPQELAAMSSAEKARTLVPKSYSEQELDRFLDTLPAKKATGGEARKTGNL